MLDTSSRANFKPTAEIDDLDVLAKAVREHLQASANAAQNFLEHTLDAGDALIRAKAQVKHGEWLPWLKLCDLSADKAERYMKLARHRAELEQALAEIHSDVMKRLMAQLEDLRSARALVDFIAAQDWESVDADTRAIALFEINRGITALRDSARRELPL